MAVEEWKEMMELIGKKDKGKGEGREKALGGGAAREKYLVAKRYKKFYGRGKLRYEYLHREKHVWDFEREVRKKHQEEREMDGCTFVVSHREERGRGGVVLVTTSIGFLVHSRGIRPVVFLVGGKK